MIIINIFKKKFFPLFKYLIGSLVTPQAVISPYLFTLGIVFFSGTLFHRVWTDSKEFSKFAPYGGISMMIGWALLAFKK